METSCSKWFNAEPGINVATLCCMGVPLGEFLLQPPPSLPPYNLKLFEMFLSAIAYAFAATRKRLIIMNRLKFVIPENMGRFITGGSV